MPRVTLAENKIAMQKSREFMQTLLNKTKRENPESPSAAQGSAKRPRQAEPGTKGKTKAKAAEPAATPKPKAKGKAAPKAAAPVTEAPVAEEPEQHPKVAAPQQTPPPKKPEENGQKNMEQALALEDDDDADDNILPPASVKQETLDSANGKVQLSHAARWAQFQRSLQPTSQRAGRAPKCPEHIARRIKSEPPVSVRAWFDLYQECGQEWGALDLLVTMAWREKTARAGGKRWMTRFDLMQKYGQDARTVDTIIQLKLKDPKTWKPNPDAPTLDTATLYKCWDFETETDTAESETATQLSLSTSVGQSEARSIVPSIIELGLAKNMPCLPAAGNTAGMPSSSNLPQCNADADKDAEERKKKLEAEKEKKRLEKGAEAERKNICPAQKRGGGL